MSALGGGLPGVLASVCRGNLSPRLPGIFGAGRGTNLRLGIQRDKPVVTASLVRRDRVVPSRLSLGGLGPCIAACVWSESIGALTTAADWVDVVSRFRFRFPLSPRVYRERKRPPERAARQISCRRSSEKVSAFPSRLFHPDPESLPQRTRWRFRPTYGGG